MNFCLRRLYSTEVPKLPSAFSARTASTPLAVRLRRSKKLGRELKPGETDATEDGLTPTEQARYTRSKLKGLLPRVPESTDTSRRYMTAEEWGHWLNARRSRVRGIRTVKQDGTIETHVVGVPIFLPNIVFKMVRNNTPEGQPYNPYEATFRIPLSVTKTDIRSYLHAVYGIKTTYIRTDVYYPSVPTYRQLRLQRMGRKLILRGSYKRAVVGLVEPFYYPHRMEDMSPSAKAERETYLDDHFQRKEQEVVRRIQLLRLANKISPRREKWLLKSIQSEGGTSTEVEKILPVSGRANILKKVAEQRRQRETIIHRKADEFAKRRLAVAESGKKAKKVAPEMVTGVPSLSERVSGWISRL